MINYFKKKEDGEILILFSFVLILILLLIALSTDFVLYKNEVNKLQEVGHLIKDIRFDKADELFNSHTPKTDFDKLAKDIGSRNGISSDKVETKWEGDVTSSNPEGGIVSHRKVKTTIVLRETYNPIFLKLFNIYEIPIKVSIEDELFAEDPIWAPPRR